MNLVFDLETAADLSVIPHLKPVRAAANLTDPAKIARDLVEKRAKQLDGLSLDPAACRIVALGWTGMVAVCPTIEIERDAIGAFWQAAVGHTLVGFNCVGFDLPVLITRSRILGVTCPDYDIRKYGCNGVVDLMLHLSFGGVVDYKSLSFWCARFGLIVPEDTVDGSAIGALVALNEWDMIAAHCRCDVEKTAALARRLGLAG